MARLALRDIEQQNYLTGNSYNWFDAVTSPGLRQNYDANISGGLVVLSITGHLDVPTMKDTCLGMNIKL